MSGRFFTPWSVIQQVKSLVGPVAPKWDLMTASVKCFWLSEQCFALLSKLALEQDITSNYIIAPVLLSFKWKVIHALIVFRFSGCVCVCLSTIKISWLHQSDLDIDDIHFHSFLTKNATEMYNMNEARHFGWLPGQIFQLEVGEPAESLFVMLAHIHQMSPLLLTYIVAFINNK